MHVSTLFALCIIKTLSEQDYQPLLLMGGYIAILITLKISVPSIVTCHQIELQMSSVFISIIILLFCKICFLQRKIFRCFLYDFLLFYMLLILEICSDIE